MRLTTRDFFILWAIITALAILECRGQMSLRSGVLVSVATGRVSEPAGSPTPDLVWWQFNDNTGTNATDSSTVATNVIRLSSDSMWVEGKSGYGITGNGSSYCGITPAPILYGTNRVVTVCCWIKDVAYSATQIIFESSTNYGVSQSNFVAYISSGTQATFGMRAVTTGTLSQAVTLPPSNSWQHVALIVNYDDTTGYMKVFTNGVNAYTSANFDGNAAVLHPHKLYLLSRNGTALFGDFAIDDFRIYSGDRSTDLPSIVADPK